MGLFDKIKRNFDGEYDLEDLEDLVYDDKIEQENIQSNIITDSIEKADAKTKIPENPVERKRQETMDEEEKYDHLLNSVQAQDLIKTVDRLNKGDASAIFQEKNVSLPNVNKKPKKLETVDLDKFKGQDIEVYVKEQCDIMEEAAAYMESAKEEYEIVTEHFSDIQAIEEAPENIRNNIVSAAERVDSLAIDRRIFRTSEQKLSNNAYHNIEKYENELPAGIKYLEKQETYYGAVQRDMRIIEGERMALRIESKQLVKRQLKIKKMALGFIFCIVAVYIIFMIAILTSENDENIALLLLVTGLSAAFALSMFAILKATQRQVIVTEIKLNKATALLNKIKIKYINAANTLDYEYNKYHVKSSYELERKYEAYVQMKSEQLKVMQLTSNLNALEVELEKILKQAGVYDTHIWLGQVRALFNPKEMVEVRHNLNVQRQKLRNQIEYNEKRIEEAKLNIKEITVKNPAYSAYALRIIEMYEQKNKLKQ